MALTEERLTMSQHAEFLLERFVHHLLSEDAAPTRRLVAEAVDAGKEARAVYAEVLWPAAECVQQLHYDGFLPTRLFNRANRSLFALAGGLALPARACAATDQRLFICSAPGELSDLGAHLLSVLAESHGYTALFAGAHLSFEEITFALSRLTPNAVLIHGSLASSLGSINTLLGRLRGTRFWPEVQMAAVGAGLGPDAFACEADLVSRDPLEILELLALCPTYRSAPGGTGEGTALQMPAGTTPVIDEGAVRSGLLRHFPGRLHWN